MPCIEPDKVVQLQIRNSVEFKNNSFVTWFFLAMGVIESVLLSGSLRLVSDKSNFLAQYLFVFKIIILLMRFCIST